MAGNTVKDMTMNFRKLDKFERHDFRRWQKKMHFLLTTLKVVYVLTTPMSELLEDATVEAIRIRKKWENDDYICKGHILNGMSDSLFDVYTNVESTKELWDSLESKYMAEDSSSKKFLLGSHLHIKESLRAQDNDKGKGKEVGVPSVNMAEEDKNKHNKQNKGKKRLNENDSGSCSNKKPEGLRTNPTTKVDAITWWIDFGATTHVCKDRCWFKTFKPVEEGSVLYMGDEHFAPVHGKGSVALEFSSRKTVTLFNVLYVPKLRKNLVSGHVLNNCGYKQIYESNKAVVRLPDPKRKTLGEKGIDCIFVGYVEHSKAYWFYVIKPNDSISINLIIESRDAIFDENRFSSIPRPKDIIPNVQESQIDDHSDEDAAFWKEAIDDEIGSIMENSTWVLSDLPPGCKPLGCKWIFKRKMKVDGTIDKFKARLVIQGFRQKEGIDYFDTYAPVAHITTIRLLLALAAVYNLVIHQMDVKTTFLNGDLDKEVYMKQLEGFVMPGNEHKVCKLVKSLYGLKQAPKQWHQKFDEVVLLSGFCLKQSDKCVYRKFDNSSKGVIICLYVDDMLIYGTDQNQVDKTKKFLSSRFPMKDMGEADVILDCSPVSTPIDPVEKLKPNTRKPVDQLEYSRAIGCLMYAMTSTRPDIAYAIGRLSYSDASWINHVEDLSSTSGWVFLLGGGAISRASKKQTCITGSTMESKFVALAAADKEAEWLRNLIHEIPIWPKPIAPISI
uniref:Zinc finger, CCHC-type n=1 Tax=Tanacetum cinerariifolium TaxID=118510 RepID=A0A6L2JIM8_TANCI|nr:zinc finger, CCHC-type [Tanacetum cinerariifolium]